MTKENVYIHAKVHIRGTNCIFDTEEYFENILEDISKVLETICNIDEVVNIEMEDISTFSVILNVTGEGIRTSYYGNRLEPPDEDIVTYLNDIGSMLNKKINFAKLTTNVQFLNVERM